MIIHAMLTASSELMGTRTFPTYVMSDSPTGQLLLSEGVESVTIVYDDGSVGKWRKAE